MCPQRTSTKAEMAAHIAKAHSFLKLTAPAVQDVDGLAVQKTAPVSGNLAIIKTNLKTKPALNDRIASARQKRFALLENMTTSEILMRSSVKCVPCAETAPLWQCLACRQQFVDRMDLHDHVQLRHVESEENKSGPLKLRMLGHCCEVCGRCFDELEYMIGHHLAMHPDANPPSFKYLQDSSHCAMLCFTCLQYYRRSEKWFTDHNCANSVDLEALEKTKCAVSIDPGFLCDVCAATFRFKCVYQYHRVISHRGVTEIDWENLKPATIPFSCENCDKGFLKINDFQTHACDTAADKLPLPTNTRVVECPQCTSKLANAAVLRRHIKSVHEPWTQTDKERKGRGGKSCRPDVPTIRCSFCEEVKFMTSKDMLAHAKEVHNQELRNPYYCAKCDKQFTSNPQLTEHYETYHTGPEDEQTVMAVCRLAQHTNNDTVFYSCPKCGRKYIDPMEYFRYHQWHQRKHEFTCDRCGRSLPSASSLNMHMRSVHSDISMPKFACDMCDSVLCSRYSLREHQAVLHGSERPFVCERCGKDFATKVRLQIHLRSHVFGSQHRVSQWRYSCDLCGRDFKKKETLRDHLAWHSGVKDVACSECGKLFYSKLSVYFHKLAMHCTERPYKCAVCRTAFPLRSFLTRHMKKHPEKKAKTNVSVAQSSTKSVVQNEPLKATNSETAQSFLHDLSR